MKNPLRLVFLFHMKAATTNNHTFVPKSTVVYFFWFPVPCSVHSKEIFHCWFGFYILFDMCLSSCIFIGYRDQSHVCFRVGEAFVVWMSLSIFGLQRYTMLATSIPSMLCSLHLSRLRAERSMS